MIKKWNLVVLASVALAMSAGGVLAQEGRGQGNREERMKRMRERMSRDDGAPKVGDVAPTFTLKSRDGKQETNLASFQGKKPVVLFFGSYT